MNMKYKNKYSTWFGATAMLLMISSCDGFLDKMPDIWGIERSGFFNDRGKWAKGFENQRV